MGKKKKCDSPQVTNQSNTNNSSSDISSNNNITINNSVNNSTRIDIPFDNLSEIIENIVKTAENVNLNLSQSNLTNIETSNIANTETTTEDTGTAAPSPSIPSSTAAPGTSTSTPCQSFAQNVSQTAALLQNVNSIREQLARLNFDPTQRIYFENCVNPLLTTLYELSASSVTLITAVNFLYTSPVVHQKNSRLKDATRLVYHIVDECEEVFDVLKKRVDILIDM